MTTPESKAAKLLGRKGGRSKSESKVQAARDNGKMGGRPNTRKMLQWIEAHLCRDAACPGFGCDKEHTIPEFMKTKE